MNIDLAMQALEWAHPIQSDANGKVIKVSVPAHEGRLAIVSIDRQEKFWNCSCSHQSSPENDPVACKAGMGKQSNICYHIIAAVMKATLVVAKKGFVYFYQDKEEAKQANVAGNMMWEIRHASPHCAEYGFAFVVWTPFPQSAEKPKYSWHDKPCGKCKGRVAMRVNDDKTYLICMGASGKGASCGWRDPPLVEAKQLSVTNKKPRSKK